MKISVVIPCFNGAEFVAGQLEALTNQQWEGGWEICFADNGSTDDSVAIAERYKERLPNLRIVDASQRKGQPYALNTGARAATGDALLFCDADDEVGPGWLEAMGKALEKYDFVACRLDAEKLNPEWLRATRSYTQRDGLQQVFFPPYLPHAGGCTLGVKRTLFEAVGGFDDELPAIHDTFFCIRAQQLGRTELHFVPDAVVHYRYRTRIGEIYRQAHSYGQYEVLLYKKALALGTPRIPHPWREATRSWWMLAKNLRWLRTRGVAAWYVFKIGYRMGRIRGSLKHGVAAF